MVGLVKEYLEKPVQVDTRTLGIDEKYSQVRLSIGFVCGMVGISRITYYRWSNGARDMRKGSPHNGLRKYTPEHEQMVISELNRHPDLTPDELIAHCLDRLDENLQPAGIYLGSRSYVYRVMRKNKLSNARRSGNKGQRHNVNSKRLVATGPNQVWCWDITYLYSIIEGEYFFLYAILDLFSRLLVGYEVHTQQTDMLAAKFLERALRSQGIVPAARLAVDGRVDIDTGSGLILHSDNGGPMKGKNMLFKMAEMGIEASYSRPHHSNDNAFAESFFATLKHSHHLPIPKAFVDAPNAQQWVNRFADWYNNVHLHSGINFITPQQCHNGEGPAIMARRNAVIAQSGLPVSKLFVMPKQVSLMNFATRRKQVERCVKAEEYKLGSKGFVA